MVQEKNEVTFAVAIFLISAMGIIQLLCAIVKRSLNQHHFSGLNDACIQFGWILSKDRGYSMHRGPGVPVVFCFVSAHTYMYPCCCYVFWARVILCHHVFKGCLSVSSVVLHAWFHLVTQLLLECNLDYLVVVQVIFCNGSDLLNSIFILFLFSSWKSLAFVLYSSPCWFCFSHSTSLF